MSPSSSWGKAQYPYDGPPRAPAQHSIVTLACGVALSLCHCCVASRDPTQKEDDAGPEAPDSPAGTAQETHLGAMGHSL